MSGIYNFPDEMVSNEKKKSFDFAKEYMSAVWAEWSNRIVKRNKKFDEWKAYAQGKQDIESCKRAIKRKFIKEEFLHIDWDDKLKVLPQMLRNYKNSIDISEFSPAIKAIDYGAMEIKNNRKNEKLKLLAAKDFLTQAAELNGGMSPIPLDQISESKEQVTLEEDSAKPLRVERGEEKALQFVLLENHFEDKFDDIKDDAVDYNLFGFRLETNPVEGIKLHKVNARNLIYGERNDKFYSDSPYYGEVKEITVGMFRNICKESGVSFTDEEIRKMVSWSTDSKITNKTRMKVVFYAFKTYFQESNVIKNVYSKKIGKKTGAVKLIPEEDYKPRSENEKINKVIDNYDVWFEGVMVLDSDRTIIRHRLVKNMPEYKGKILPPYIICSPREVALMEEIKPAIDSLQQLRYKILHHRGILKGTITDIDPDSLAEITLGKEALTPEEVLSFYFSLNLSFTKRVDSDGEPINGMRPINEIPAAIPYALRELSQQYISELQAFYQSFGAFQYDQAKPDPKTMDINEPFRLSDNLQLRDITNSLFNATTKVLQNISSRINDAVDFPLVKEKFIDNIGFDDFDALEQWKKDRSKHAFHIYTDFVMSKKDRADLMNAVDAHIQRGELEVSDKIELGRIKNAREAAAKLTLKVMANRKQMAANELNKIKENQNQNILAAQASGEQNRQTLQLDHQLRMERDRVKFEQDAFLLQKNGEIKIAEANVQGEAKINAAQFSSQFTADLAMAKKRMDEETALKKLDKSKENQAELIKLRQGKIEDVNQNSQMPAIDLSTIN